MGRGDEKDRVGRGKIRISKRVGDMMKIGWEGKMRVSWKDGEGDEEDRVGRGKLRVSRKGGEGYNEEKVIGRVGRGMMSVSRKGGEEDDEDRVGRGKMRVSRKGGKRAMKIG